MYEAGLPKDVLHLLPGEGSRIGAQLVSNPSIAGVAFTGSFETAKVINQSLAARPGPIVPLIAETGGINAMIVDSTALPEQVVDDVLASCFQSAGQRCSALRILLLQDDVADDIIDMLCGKAAELIVGDPALLSTDVGPVIDQEAKNNLLAHARQMDTVATLLFKSASRSEEEADNFFAPRIYLLDSIQQLEHEVFGPILHIVRYQADEIDQVIEAINGTGFGLTLGIHSRIDRFAKYLHDRLKVGNTYINRNMIGAVVGVQPFGGEGLSGTGPKAGGSRYLQRFAVERTLTINTAAIGGNAALLSR
jgi:RHH-type proline utilization regulon transcriptional repressor/proline dehydrogenase/delta 1-pyrroline-5-carboxylate dehydrogenase